MTITPMRRRPPDEPSPERGALAEAVAANHEARRLKSRHNAAGRMARPIDGGPLRGHRRYTFSGSNARDCGGNRKPQKGSWKLSASPRSQAIL